ncbi:MAG: penicillin-binding protein 1C [Prevotellaceae bacterium]|nr:penicillin-binding protein 1C [Prevotellaceae bacterium]
MALRFKKLEYRQIYGYVKKWFPFGVYTCLVIFLWSPYKTISDPYCTVIESSDGELLGAGIASDGQWRFRERENLPDTYIQSTVVFEDKRFYRHQGIDFIAILRALNRNIGSGKATEGASTISMQVVRLMRKGKKRTFKEKIIETLYALKLETQFSKREILALYASNAPFGSNVVGIDAASWRYFGRNAADLSWCEAATLAVLPNAPSLIHPGKNRETLKNKRNELLNRLHEKKIINDEMLTVSKIEHLPDKPLPMPRLSPHLLDKISYSYRGKRIKTTISRQLQQSVSNLTESYVKTYKANLVHNAAVIVAEIESGNVLAYAGNVIEGNSQHGGSVDMITAPRSSGSILKPFLYAAMLDDGAMLPDALVPDIPLHIAGFSPHNFSRSFDGAVPASEALTRSLNVPAVKMLAEYNVEKFHRLLKDLGMTTITKPAGHYGLSLILGGAEATLWDVAGMYADMARTVNNFGKNSGRYSSLDRKKLNYIMDSSHGKTEKNGFSRSGIINAAAIWQTLEALSELNRPEEESSWKMFSSGRKIAWKTGTSYGNRDAWAVGVTPDYLVGVWVGNASGEGRPLLTGVGYAAPLMFDVWNLLPRSKEWFRQPFDEMTKIATCRESGRRAGEHCENIDSIWVNEAGLSTGVCPYHRLIFLDRDEKYRVNSSCCPVHEMLSRKWFVLPPAQEWYFKQRHLSYRPLPPADPRCTDDEHSPMQMIYPGNGISIVAARQFDGKKGKIVFQAAHNKNNSTIYWHIDEQYIGSTTSNHQIACLPESGNHVLTIVDDEGHSLITVFTVD